MKNTQQCRMADRATGRTRTAATIVADLRAKRHERMHARPPPPPSRADDALWNGLYKACFDDELRRIKAAWPKRVPFAAPGPAPVAVPSPMNAAAAAVPAQPNVGTATPAASPSPARRALSVDVAPSPSP